MTATDVTAAIRAHAFRFENEAELQAGIAIALAEHRIAFEREVVLSGRDRIDFVVGTVGIEVKLKVGTNEVIRQLHRYAQHGALSSLILVTSSLRLASSIPHEMNGKVIVPFCLAGDAL